MGLALFYGNKATAHADATERWRKLWLAEDELAQRDRQIELEDQYRQSQLDIQRDQHRLAERTQSWGEFMDEENLRIKFAELDEQQTQNLMETVDPWFEGGSALQRALIVSDLQTHADEQDSSALRARLIPLKQRLQDELFDLQEAYDILTQYFQPFTFNQSGSSDIIPPFLADAALRVLKSHDAVGVDEIEALLNAKRDGRYEELDYVNKSYLESLGLNVATAEANLEGATLKNQQTSLENSFMEMDLSEYGQVLEDNARARRNEIEAGELANASERVKQEYLREGLETDLRNAVAGAIAQEQLNEFTAESMPYELRRLAAEADITEAELNFLIATEAARIRGVELSNDNLEAVIRQLEADTEGKINLNSREAHNFILAMVASGQTDFVEAYGERFFEDLEPSVREKVMENLIGLSKENFSYARAERESDLLLANAKWQSELALANQRNAEATAIPVRTAQGWVSVETDRMNAETNRQNMLLNALKPQGASMTIRESYDAALKSIGIDGSYIPDELSALDNMEAELRMLDGLIEGGGDIDSVASLMGRLEGLGITLPDSITANWAGVESLIAVRDNLRSALETREKNLEMKAQGLQTLMNLSAEQPVHVFDLAGIFVDPNDIIGENANSTAVGRLFNSLDMRNSVTATGLQEELESLIEAGVLSEAAADILPFVSVSLARIGAVGGQEGFLFTTDDVELIYEGLLENTFGVDASPEMVRAALDFLDINGPEDLAEFMEMSASDVMYHSQDVYGAEDLFMPASAPELDLGTPEGMATAWTHLSRAADATASVLHSALPGASQSSGTLAQKWAQRGGDVSPSEAFESIDNEMRGYYTEIANLLGVPLVNFLDSYTTPVFIGGGSSFGQESYSVPVLRNPAEMQAMVEDRLHSLRSAAFGLEQLQETYGTGFSRDSFYDSRAPEPISRDSGSLFGWGEGLGGGGGR